MEVAPTPHELAIVEMKHQMTKGQKTYDSVDMKSKRVTHGRVHKVVWPMQSIPITEEYLDGLFMGTSAKCQDFHSRNSRTVGPS
jgi:hypothetical protein